MRWFHSLVSLFRRKTVWKESGPLTHINDAYVEAFTKVLPK